MKVAGMLGPLGFEMFGEKFKFRCYQKRAHNVNAEHVVDILASYSSRRSRCCVIVESKRSIGSSDALASEVIGVANKGRCLQYNRSFSRRFPRVDEGIIITEDSIGPRRLESFENAVKSVLADKRFYVYLIQGSHFKALLSLSHYVRDNSQNPVTGDFLSSLNDGVLMENRISYGVEWLNTDKRVYRVTIQQDKATVGIFDFSSSYTLDDWTSDSQAAAKSGLAIDRIEVRNDFTGEVIDAIRDLGRAIPLVNHRLETVHFDDFWDYTVRE